MFERRVFAGLSSDLKAFRCAVVELVVVDGVVAGVDGLGGSARFDEE